VCFILAGHQMDDHSREQLQEFSGKTETSKSTNELRTSSGYKSRRGRGRSLPYMNMRGRKLGRADAMGMCVGPPPLPPLFPPPPLPMHLRGPHPPLHRHGPPPLPPPPPPRHPPFRGFPRCPRGRGMMPLDSHRHFHPRG
ncbi:cleavage and polyadenylation specificity factor subunit 6-like isoform X2, partial [Clarias magur]